MKKRFLFFLLLVPVFLMAQVNETFSDGNFTQNPTWEGTVQNFVVNSSGELQSSAAAAGNFWLFTPSQSFVNASWECRLKINYSTSSSNYAAVYIASDVNDLSNGCNGYYIQIGGTNDEVSLFLQQGTKKTKIIDGSDKRTDGNPVNIRVRLTRDATGKFVLYSKLPTETEYFEEGSTENTVITQSSYFGLFYANTSTTGSAYFFDDINVSGDRVIDTTPPLLNSLSMILPETLNISFNEKMNFANSIFDVDNGIGQPITKRISEDYKSIQLTFQEQFSKGKLYELTLKKVYDAENNKLLDTIYHVGITESMVQGDVVWNEIMFEAPLNSTEYAEIYNRSSKLIDMSQLGFATRKTNGDINTLCKFPTKTYLAPGEYLAFTDSVELVRNYHQCPENAHIVKSVSWPSLNNDGATLVLCNLTRDTIADEITYSPKWHHVSVKNPKGVALEKINPDLPGTNATSWHSASWETNYGTPGYRNSQFREITDEALSDKTIWTDPEAFSPDNDGTDDVCLIRYKLPAGGYVGSLTITNSAGVKMCTPATNILLSTEGFISWDGKTDRGQSANAGIYVIYFEIFNPLSGEKIIKKLPVAVSYR